MFDNNSADVGGAFYADNNDVYVEYCTIYNNPGGAIRAATSGISYTNVHNSIIWGHDGWVITSDGLTASYSNIQDGPTGDGNTDTDPMFVDAAGGDLSLSAGSPCIDAADGDSAPELDLLGNPRRDDPATPNSGARSPAYVDMGAYEFQP